MTDPQLILVILGSLFAFWQIVVAGMGIAALASGRYTSMKIGFRTGFIATALFIAAVLV